MKESFSPDNRFNGNAAIVRSQSIPVYKSLMSSMNLLCPVNLLKSLAHENLVRYLDYFSQYNRWKNTNSYLIMENYLVRRAFTKELEQFLVLVSAVC